MVDALYVDTSAFVKRYDPSEEGAPDVEARVTNARVSSSVLLYAETLSAIARKRREGRLDDDRTEALRGRIRQDYLETVRVQLSPAVLEEAGRLLFVHPLRANDAVHLGSALVLARTRGREDLPLLTADVRLADAASAEGLPVERVAPSDG